jgi:23S rRNA (guanine745-N1)-methyltransferase
MRLSAGEVRTLIGMTPSARHVALDDLDARPLTVTAAVDLSVYHPS